ncbi:MAG TPA: hypothetical protein EYP34_08445 [Chromatiaceae bacterium]|nr:hypothetical protein [Chromatiaceae bacterium]
MTYDPRTVLPDTWQGDARMLTEAFKTGAMVGGTGAAALNIYRVKKENMEPKKAVFNTAKFAASAGVATVAATSVGAMVRKQPLLSFLAAFATGTAVMYVLTNPNEPQDVLEVDDE